MGRNETHSQLGRARGTTSFLLLAERHGFGQWLPMIRNSIQVGISRNAGVPKQNPQNVNAAFGNLLPEHGAGGVE